MHMHRHRHTTRHIRTRMRARKKNRDIKKPGVQDENPKRKNFRGSKRKSTRVDRDPTYRQSKLYRTPGDASKSKIWEITS